MYIYIYIYIYVYMYIYMYIYKHMYTYIYIYIISVSSLRYNIGCVAYNIEYLKYSNKCLIYKTTQLLSRVSNRDLYTNYIALPIALVPSEGLPMAAASMDFGGGSRAKRLPLSCSRRGRAAASIRWRSWRQQSIGNRRQQQATGNRRQTIGYRQ